MVQCGRKHEKAASGFGQRHQECVDEEAESVGRTLSNHSRH